MTPAQIAAGLSKAQRDALLALCDLGSNPYGWSAGQFSRNGMTAYSLYNHGLAHRLRAHGGTPTYLASETGQSVRTILERQDNE